MGLNEFEFYINVLHVDDLYTNWPLPGEAPHDGSCTEKETTMAYSSPDLQTKISSKEQMRTGSAFDKSGVIAQDTASPGVQRKVKTTGPILNDEMVEPPYASTRTVQLTKEGK